MGWFEALRLDLLGAIQATRLSIGFMRRRGVGAIVNVASTSVQPHGGGHSPWPGYDVAKTGIMRLTTALGRLRDQENIRVNCLIPAWSASPGPKEYWESLTPEQRRERRVPDKQRSPAPRSESAIRLL